MLAGPMPARALARAVLLASFLAASIASPAAGAEAVPPEAAVLLDGESFGAMVGDIDGDGVRELVRLVPWGVNPSQKAVEVISIRGGVPRSHGHHLVERVATPDDTFAGNNPAQNPLMAVGIREPTRLIAWRGPDGERVLVGGIGVNDLPRPCCLTLWWVILDRSGTTELEYIQDTMSSSAHVLAMDLDEDGIDELAVVETPDPNFPNDTRVLVLRWNGTDFDRIESRARDALISGPLLALGDTDGLPGAEFGFAATPARFDQIIPSLHRFRLKDDRLMTEHAELPADGSVTAVRGPDGGRVVVISPSEAYLLEWRAGQRDATILANSIRGGSLLGVLGRGAGARLLVLRGGAVDVLDAGLTSRQSVFGGEAASWFAASSLPPYAGQLPGGDDAGAPAMIFGGQLVSAPDGSALAAVRDIAALPGRSPVGLFGPERGWAAVANGAALAVGRRGGSMGVTAEARAAGIAVVPAGLMMRPEEDGGLLEPEIRGAILDAAMPARPMILTSAGATARFAAPPDSALQVSGFPGEPVSSSVGAGGMADVVLVPARDTGDDESFTVRLLVATPAGHGYGAIWEVRVLRRPPGLTATAPFASLSFSVPLSGRTAPSASLLVDGEPVSLGPDGTFMANVSAGPLPRTVRLAATDRVGNTTELAVSVVGVLDYRRLPWIPIVVGLTMLAAGILYLRVPKPSAVPATDPDHGVLEEME